MYVILYAPSPGLTNLKELFHTDIYLHKHKLLYMQNCVHKCNI